MQVKRKEYKRYVSERRLRDAQYVFFPVLFVRCYISLLYCMYICPFIGLYILIFIVAYILHSFYVVNHLFFDGDPLADPCRLSTFG